MARGIIAVECGYGGETALWSSWQNRSMANFVSQKRERCPAFGQRNIEELFI